MTFAPGDTVKTISVPIVDDDVEDGGETFTVTLSNPAGATLGNRTATGTIHNNDDNDDDGSETPGDALTASFEGVPEAHGGPDSEAFTFRVRFNLEPRVSYKVLRDESFAVTGGEVRKARRVDGRDDLREIHVEPEGWDDVRVMLAGGRACGTRGAVCTADGKVLANTATVVVKGPVALRVADARAREGIDATLDFAVVPRSGVDADRDGAVRDDGRNCQGRGGLHRHRRDADLRPRATSRRPSPSRYSTMRRTRARRP